MEVFDLRKRLLILRLLNSTVRTESSSGEVIMKDKEILASFAAAAQTAKITATVHK